MYNDFIMWKPADPIQLTSTEKRELQRIVSAPKSPQKMVMRCRIILRAAEGESSNRIAQELHISRPTVIAWRTRFLKERLAGLHDAPRSGRTPSLSSHLVNRIVHTTQFEKPKDATQWSTRSMAKRFGVSHMTVQRIWREYNLKPHRMETFKISQDPAFVEKVEDIVGLYLNPPDHALVLCVDEKTQIQALDRTQALLPMRPGQVERRTHDYVRHGTTSLFAALDVAKGIVIADCYSRHRHQEFLDFLKQIDRRIERHVDLHIVLDNYGTHKHSTVQAWVKTHPRFHFHFTPTGASWLNQVELWFSLLTQKRIRRGVFRSLKSLVVALNDYVKINNANAKPFVWTKNSKYILKHSPHCKDIKVTEH
jgi:transposase